MKSGSGRILRLFWICLAFVIMIVPMNTAAKTGHGGTTRVIARIEAPSAAQSSDFQPESSSQESSEKESSSESPPVSTGDAVPVILFITSAVSLALVMAAFRGRGEQH